MSHPCFVSFFVKLIVVSSHVISGVFEIYDRVESLAKLVEVPLTNFWLSLVPISSPILVRVVADKVRIEVFHPSIRTVINCQS